jgi:hypothetical protein
MPCEQLEHTIRVACEVCEDSEIWIFGSRAILGEFSNTLEDLRASIEVDVQPKNHLKKSTLSMAYWEFQWACTI